MAEELINADHPLGEMDPLIYGGYLTELRKGAADGGKFLIAPREMMVAEYDMTYITSTGDEQLDTAHLIVTFKGRVNNTQELVAYTVLMPYGTSMHMLRHMRKLSMEVPLRLRTQD